MAHINFTALNWQSLTTEQLTAELRNQLPTDNIGPFPSRIALIATLTAALSNNQQLGILRPLTPATRTLLSTRTMQRRPILQLGAVGYHSIITARPVSPTAPPMEKVVAMAVADPYLGMSSSIYAAILHEREIREIGGRLADFDIVEPEWSEKALSGKLEDLTIGQIYYRLAAQGLNLNELIFSEDKERLISMTEVAELGPIALEVVEIPKPRTAPETIKTFVDLWRYAQARTRPNFSDEVIHSLPEINRVTYRRAVTDDSFFGYPPTISREDFLKVMKLPHRLLYETAEMLLPRDAELYLYTPTEVIFMLTRRKIPPVTMDIEKQRLRFQKYRSASATVQKILKLLYGAERIKDMVTNYHNIFDEVVMDLDRMRLDEFLAKIGMVLPPHITDIKQYLVNNVSFYQRSYYRDKSMPLPTPHMDFSAESDLRRYLSQFTDPELIHGLGVYVAYQSRNHLLDTLQHLIRNGNRFFIPFQRHSRNLHTFLGTDTRNLENFMVAYGGVTNYMCYEPDELVMVFDFLRDSEDESVQGDFVFARPENRNLIFDLDEIKQLRTLAEIFKQHLQELYDRIEVGMEAVRMQYQIDNEIRKIFHTFDEKYHSRIREFFIRFFETGMYMRRWRGPGHPYPLQEEATLVKVEPDAAVLDAYGRLKETQEQLPTNIQKFLMGLRIMEYREGQYDKLSWTIETILESVFTGAFCIRMASTKFITTAFAYLRTFFSERMPGFDIASTSIIQ